MASGEGVQLLHNDNNISVTNAIYSPLIYSPPFVSDSEISGRGPARQRLRGITGNSYSNTGLYHVVVNNFLDSKAQTLLFLLEKDRYFGLLALLLLLVRIGNV